jgi:NitT/TauT family transport system substrate-binding protein
MFSKLYRIFTIRHVLFIVALLLVSGLLTACNTSTPTPEPAEVTIQLSWFHTVEFAGFYAAEQQGYYAEENLAVNLVPGGFDARPWREVAEGRADFGVTGGNLLLMALSEGLPVRAIAAIFRQSPVALMALAESGIRTPQDLAGKRVGIISPEMDDGNDIQFLAMLRQLEIDESEMELVVIEDYSVGSLTSGAMDVSSVFSTNEPVGAELQGVDVNLIFPQDYGVLIYANVLFARQGLTEEQPDLVERFVRATLRGYQYAIEHPDEASDLTLKYDETLDSGFQRASMRAEIPLIDTGDAPIGTMDKAVWQSTQDMLLEQGFISSPVDLNALYTNEFVEKSQ